MNNIKKYVELYNGLTGGRADITKVKNADPNSYYYDIVQSVYDYLDTVPEEKIETISFKEAQKGWIAYMEDNCEKYASDDEDTYSCEICGRRHKWDDLVWLNSSYGVCEHCDKKIPKEIRKKLLEDIWDLDVDMWSEKISDKEPIIKARKEFLAEHRKETILFFFNIDDVQREDIESGITREEMAEKCCCMILLKEFDNDWNDSDDEINHIPDKLATWCYVSLPEK